MPHDINQLNCWSLRCNIACRCCANYIFFLHLTLGFNILHKTWTLHDALIQSAGGIANNASDHGDANIAIWPILGMHIRGQIRLLNAIDEDGYSNAPPSRINIRMRSSFGQHWVQEWYTIIVALGNGLLTFGHQVNTGAKINVSLWNQPLVA